MYIEQDYIDLWRHLVENQRILSSERRSSFDQKERAKAYEAGTRKKNQGKDDPLITFIAADIKPEETALDIGAGTGRWTIPLAKAADQVTALEPSPAMRDILQQNAHEAGVAEKVNFAASNWEDAKVQPHDVVVCSHAMYSNPDFPGFIRKMESVARRRCCLGLRLFRSDGVIQELHNQIYGQPHDTPNFIVAYNALHQMGIYGNVLVEELKHNWTSPDLDMAFERALKHLRLEDNTDYDLLISETLERRLQLKEGEYHWPDTMSTALVWWDIDQSGRC